MHTARLIGITKPVTPDIPSPGALLAFCARVSSTANQSNHETGPRLLRSLIRRQEWSPLEMVSLTVEIETTRDIARQILRHRSFSFQEFSQRYAVVDEEPVTREARMQDNKDRQNSLHTSDADLQQWWQAEQEVLAAHAHEAYQQALTRGIAKEVARSVLPEGMTRSRLYMNGTLRSWVHYLMLRCDRKTQAEHREVAESVRVIVLREFPELREVFEESGL